MHYDTLAITTAVTTTTISTMAMNDRPANNTDTTLALQQRATATSICTTDYDNDGAADRTYEMSKKRRRLVCEFRILLVCMW